MGMVTGSGNTAIHQLFSYDSSGNVVSVDYSSNGGSTFTTYYYLRNAQNDIVKIIDGNGATVVEYKYDSWGKPISTTGSLSATLGANQPFRYRGYVYDTETGWYYLQSRYYDPSIGRFISADVLLSTGQGVLGHNSYAYCLNNPVNMGDDSGCLADWIKDSLKWIAQNIARPMLTYTRNAFSKVDATYSTGIDITLTPSVFIFSFQGGISVDTKGNIALQGSFSGGMTGGSPGASVTGYRTITNAPNINKLEGLGYQIGGSVGVPVYGVPVAAGGDFLIIPDTDTTYFGSTTNLGFGTPGGEFHIAWGATGTGSRTQINLFDLAGWFLTKIMEW